MNNYWLMLNDWKGRHDAMHPITDPATHETCYTFSGIHERIRQVTVKDLGGFNLVHYSKPTVKPQVQDMRLANLHHRMI